MTASLKELLGLGISTAVEFKLGQNQFDIQKRELELQKARERKDAARLAAEASGNLLNSNLVKTAGKAFVALIFGVLGTRLILKILRR